MGLAIAVSRVTDRLILDRLGPLGGDVYPVVRAMAIAVLMASLIAWLAVRYRREYEAKLQRRNDALRETRDFLSRIIEGSGEAIVTLDASGRVTSWNRAAEQIYGWTADEMLGQTVSRLLPPDRKIASERERIEKLLRAGKTLRNYETSRIRKDGRRIIVRVTRTPLTDGAGRFVGSTGIVRDVTAVKDMEARLLDRERLAAVGELAASVAHEIKNPLAGIRGACEILCEGFGKSDSRYEVGREVLRQVDRLNCTIEDLLLFARPKTLKPVSTDIHRVLDRSLGVLLDDPRSREIRVENRYDPDLPDLRVDPQQMEQVFINVFLNALQAMDYRGLLRVRTADSDHRAWITITDSGPGIPSEIRDRIFKPFFTTRSQGSGLGLAIVKKLVQAHGGWVDAAPADEGGTRITISLPTEIPGS